MNGRYFDTRQLKCFYWDGKTDFKIVRESDEVMNARINEFGDWLENQQLPEELHPISMVGEALEADKSKLKAKR